MDKQIKIALPKGRLQEQTASLLDEACLGLAGYHQSSRFYRIKSTELPGLTAKVFNEKDVPIQVAIGNYDFGICGLDWAEELISKYPSSGITKVRELGYGSGTIYAAANVFSGPLEKLTAEVETVRIASEYPNLAEAYALKCRIRRFSVYPLWGAAEVYPPDSAELALVAKTDGEKLNYNLAPLDTVLKFSACLIANKKSLETKDLKPIIEAFDRALACRQTGTQIEKETSITAAKPQPFPGIRPDMVRLALPDGHQQVHTITLLEKAGIKVEGYNSKSGSRRPTSNLEGTVIKVIRPQDMPLQVACGNFDLAVTGKDWLREHLYQFPSSPAVELLDLKYGRVKIVAVVSNELPVQDTAGLRQLAASRETSFRFASEYVNIADKYARDNHMGRYRIIPTWGATEAFIPEDADVLIENTETGQTIARHNLKIIEVLFESTACLVGRREDLDSAKGKRIMSIIKMFKTAVEG